MLPQDIIASRPMTEKLLGAAEIGEIYWEDVARAALRYLSERQVAEICELHEFASVVNQP